MQFFYGMYLKSKEQSLKFMTKINSFKLLFALLYVLVLIFIYRI